MEGHGNNPAQSIHPLASHYLPLVSTNPIHSIASKRNWHTHTSRALLQYSLLPRLTSIETFISSPSPIHTLSCIVSSLCVRTFVKSHNACSSNWSPFCPFHPFPPLSSDREKVPRYMSGEEHDGHTDVVRQFCNIRLQQRK